MSNGKFAANLDQGLMPKILSLIAPPSNGEKKKPIQSSSSILGRPSKPKSNGCRNNSFCDYCIENTGGFVLCCDQCPKVFHLKCCDPPLNEEDVPKGEWVCSRCRAIKLIQERYKPNSESKNSFARQNHITNKMRPTNSGDCNRNFDLLDCTYKISMFTDLSARNNPFADLVRISLLSDPKEFELPDDFVPSIQFPGTSKKNQMINSVSREARLTTYSVKRAQEIDGNDLPLILRTCYVCRRGCQKATLIHCDYCPLVYHADCTDPPLTVLPNTRWMCPNHPEPIAEEKLLTSNSYCERVKLWNHFSKPIDQELIKISFIDKVHEDLEPRLGNSADIITNIACELPNRIKSIYDKYIVNIDDYRDETDRNNRATSKDQPAESQPRSVFDQLLECSKILESSSKDSEKTSSSCQTPCDIDADAREWIDFLEQLNNNSEPTDTKNPRTDDQKPPTSQLPHNQYPTGWSNNILSSHNCNSSIIQQEFSPTIDPESGDVIVNSRPNMRKSSIDTRGPYMQK